MRRFTRMVHIELNEETDVAYVSFDRFTPKEWARRSVRLDLGTEDPIILHLDHLDRLVGIELRGAIQRFRPEFLFS